MQKTPRKLRTDGGYPKIYSKHPFIRIRKEKTFLFELTNVRINRN